MGKNEHGYGRTAEQVDQHKEKVNKHGLTERQEQFCQAYLIRFNITQAETAAGYSKGSGARLMALQKIRRRINDIRLQTGKDFNATRERLLQELMNTVYTDTRNLIDLPVSEWPEDDVAGVASVEFDLLGQVKTVKRWDKLKAIEIINKMLGYNMPEEIKSTSVNFNSETMNKEEILAISKQLDQAV